MREPDVWRETPRGRRNRRQDTTDIILETARLVMRYQSAADIAPLVDLWSDPDVTRHVGGPRDRTSLLETFEETARNPKAEAYDLWPVREKGTDAFVGHCGLLEKEIDGAKEVEINYILTRHAWGKGYGSEIAAAIADVALREKGVGRLVALIDPGNTASERVALNIGMHHARDVARPGGVKKLYVMQAQRASTGIPTIHTRLLELVSLSVEFLEAMSVGDIGRARACARFGVPEDSLLSRQPHLERRLAMIAGDPGQHPWMDRAIVRKADNLMVGYISFHHKAPDPDLAEYSECAVELGYCIDAGCRRKGYAAEGALGMIEWAALQGVAVFCLSISPQNVPSLRMAESMGFRKIAERMDETDGLEYVYRADLADVRPRTGITMGAEK